MSREPSAMQPTAATLLDCDPGRFRYSAWNNISVGIWADQATLEAAQRVIRVSKWMTARYPQGHSNIIFVLDGAPAPTPEATKIFSKVYDEKFSDLACMGIVIEGAGFWASAMRSMITNQRLHAPGNVRVRVFDGMEPLLAWFLPEHYARTRTRFQPPEIRAALTALRALAASDNGEAPQMSRA